jgi:hypothetical protein
VTASGSNPAEWNAMTIAIAVLMLVATVTFIVASVIHFGAAIPLGFVTIPSDPFRGAAIPEAVIAVALAAGSIAFVARKGTAWWPAFAAVALAVVGVLVGLSVIIRGRVSRTGDLAYHGSILILLLVIMVLLLTPRALHRH